MIDVLEANVHPLVRHHACESSSHGPRSKNCSGVDLFFPHAWRCFLGPFLCLLAQKEETNAFRRHRTRCQGSNRLRLGSETRLRWTQDTGAQYLDRLDRCRIMSMRFGENGLLRLAENVFAPDFALQK